MNEVEVRFQVGMRIKVEIRVTITARTETSVDSQDPLMTKNMVLISFTVMLENAVIAQLQTGWKLI